jgi:hypothetical protein
VADSMSLALIAGCMQALTSLDCLAKAATAFQAQHPHIFAPYSLLAAEEGQSERAQATHRPPGWIYKFSCILQRNFRSYIRNVANVLARFILATCVALVVGERRLGEEQPLL